MTNKEYNEIKAVRATHLKGFIKNSDKLAFELSQPKPVLTPDALRLGTVVHAMYLEPHVLENFFVYDAIASVTSRTAQKHVDILQDKEDWCLQSDIDKATEMVKNLPPLPEGTETERVFTKEIEGVLCKVKVDAILGNSVGMDLKTTTDASPDKFRWAIRDFGYMWQMAFYSLVTGIDSWVIRAVEKTAPYIWHDYIIKPEDLEPYKEDLLGLYGHIRQYSRWIDAGTPLRGYNTFRSTDISELL